MKISIAPLRTTILGGVVFLIPCVVVFALAAQAFKLMFQLAAPVSAWIPLDSVGGIALVNIITVLLLLIICFFAGLLARSALGQRTYRSLNDRLLTLFPRYAFIRSMTEGLSGDGVDQTLQPVRVTFDDHVQIAFEVERDESGLATVYLPGAPDPLSGSVVHVAAERVERLDTTYNAVVNRLRKVGVGASHLLR